MRAAVLHNYGQPMKVEEVEIDDPKPTEVKVKIAASGVCHSDYAFILGEQYWEKNLNDRKRANPFKWSGPI